MSKYDASIPSYVRHNTGRGLTTSGIPEHQTDQADPMESNDSTDIPAALKSIEEQNKKLLEQIGILIEEKLESIKRDLSGVKQDLSGVKHQLDSVEMKIEVVNKRVEQAQHETIKALSELVNTGYNLHEERLRHVEEHIISTSSVS